MVDEQRKNIRDIKEVKKKKEQNETRLNITQNVLTKAFFFLLFFFSQFYLGGK
jgi:1,4-dihydroxy-2-naphthoate octaprenyltransferase